MRKVLFLILLCFCMSLIQKVNAATSASQNISATLSRGGGGDVGGGAAIGIAVGGGAAAATGASAFAFAPVLLAGLSPNSVVYAAAPIGCIQSPQNFLQIAAIQHMHTKTYAEALDKMKSNCKFYLVQNDSEIINGTFNIHPLTLPKELQLEQRIKVNITISSQKYKSVEAEPELFFGVYKDISRKNLAKKFTTQQFLHHYLMKRYEIPLKITFKGYEHGLQKLSGVIDMSEIQNPQAPMNIVLRYTENGFKANQKNINPKTLVYAYIIELEK